MSDNEITRTKVDKEVQVSRFINRIKKIMESSIKKERIEVALTAISAGCQILNAFNQTYYDADFEEGIISLSKIVASKYCTECSSDENTVLFYDGFGLDSRGVSRIYLNALLKNRYHVVYVSPKKMASNMPKTKALFEGKDVKWLLLDTKKSYLKRSEDLLSICLQNRPKAMYFYSTPYDASGALAFAAMKGKTDRFLLDLTDHAFWLGVKSNDYFTGSRDISASNLIYERHVEKSKIIKLGGSILPDDSCNDHSGLPFDVKMNRYIFSGGSLYKTLGDPENTFYRIVNHVLSNHPDILFLYAGGGDTSQIDKITEKYSGRAYRIDERPDYYYLIQNCVLYLNTYPMFGGMMMKYSAYAGKLPITLIHEEDSEGLLIDQKSRKIEYSSYEELITDLDKLLSDNSYLKEREMLLNGSVVSEEDFIEDVRSTIENHKTRYEHNYSRIDTSRFREEYYSRFDIDTVIDKVSRIENKAIFPYFPPMVVNVIKRKLKKVTRREKA